MFRVSYAPRFHRAFKRLPVIIKLNFHECVEIVLRDPFDPSLKMHKLHGALTTSYAFYLRDGYRVLCRFVNPEEIYLIDVGPHDDYQKWARQ